MILKDAQEDAMNENDTTSSGNAFVTYTKRLNLIVQIVRTNHSGPIAMS